MDAFTAENIFDEIVLIKLVSSVQIICSLTVLRASERCHQEKRKTINGEDILFAMSTLGFDNYVEPLKIYLQKYREVNGYQSGMGICQLLLECRQFL